jgi:hypothetical protein
MLGDVGGLRVVDGYGGVGTFGVRLAKAGAAHVTLIESAPSSVADARVNFAANQVHGEVREQPFGSQPLPACDLLVVDPPRAGLLATGAAAIVAAAPAARAAGVVLARIGGARPRRPGVGLPGHRSRRAAVRGRARRQVLQHRALRRRAPPRSVARFCACSSSTTLLDGAAADQPVGVHGALLADAVRAVDRLLSAAGSTTDRAGTRSRPRSG